MNLRNLEISYLLIIILFSFSCTPYKNVPYFQDLKQDSVIKENIANFSQLTIQPGDFLAIHVTSLNDQADAVFNYNLERPNRGFKSNPTDVEQFVVYGYIVDNEGNINLPLINKIKVAGLTTNTIADTLQVKLLDVLSKPNVQVRLQNFKISILGDVKTPGAFNVQNEKININEALSLAGDLNSTGIRKNVLLIREKNGVREYIRLDLTSKAIFSSPYYYLKNNDVIYVQPNKERIQNDSTAFAKTSLVLTVLSILAIIFSKNL